MSDVIISPLAGILSSLVVIFCAMKLERCRPLAWIGSHSLIFMCVHLFEMETMGMWFDLVFDKLSIPYVWFNYFCFKLIFITIVSAVIIFFKQKIHFVRYSNTGLKENSRDNSIDIAKGILIVLMLIGHFSVEANFRSIIYSFHMEAFVFFSGYFFRPDYVKKMSKSIMKLIKSFLIPYAVFAIFAVSFMGNETKTVLLGISFTKEIFTGFASVGPVYFILMLFLVRILYLLVEKFCPNEYWKHGLCIAVSIAGVWLGWKGYWLPWSFDCAMYSIIFYHFGYCFRKYGMLEYFRDNLITYFALSVVWAYMIYTGSMELAVRNYGSYGMTILGAVSATVLLYMFSCYINNTFSVWIANLIGLAGKSTLYILIIHTLFNGKISNLAGLRFEVGSIYYMGIVIILHILSGVLLCKLIDKMKCLVKVRKG